MRDTLEEERLRAKPDKRFGCHETKIDLPGALRELRAEASVARHGHKQITLDQWGPLTLVLLTFEEGGSLDDHKAAGMVTIQALEGELTVRSENGEYKLLPNMMVVFAPNVRHSVVAVQESAMLLSVCLINRAAHRYRTNKMVKSPK